MSLSSSYIPSHTSLGQNPAGVRSLASHSTAHKEFTALPTPPIRLTVRVESDEGYGSPHNASDAVVLVANRPGAHFHSSVVMSPGSSSHFLLRRGSSRISTPGPTGLEVLPLGNIYKHMKFISIYHRRSVTLLESQGSTGQGMHDVVMAVRVVRKPHDESLYCLPLFRTTPT